MLYACTVSPKQHTLILKEHTSCIVSIHIVLIPVWFSLWIIFQVAIQCSFAWVLCHLLYLSKLLYRFEALPLKNKNSAAGGIRSLDRMTVLWNYDHYSQTAHISLVVQMSVCLYAIIAVENVTCTMNTSRHFGFECTHRQCCTESWYPTKVNSIFYWLMQLTTYLRKICSHQQPPGNDADYGTLFWLYKCAHISQWKTDHCSRRWTLFWP